jgi:hypothetical protein
MQNADVGQIEDQMAEAKIVALSNLLTVTTADHGVVETLTEPNARLARQFEEGSKEVNEVKALLKKERAERGGHINVTPP